MKAYIIESQRKIPPFDRYAPSIYSPFLNFGNLLSEEISLAGCGVRFIRSIDEIDSSERSLLLPDYVFVTAKILKKFILISQNLPDYVQRLSVLKSPLTEYYTFLMDYDEVNMNGEDLLLFDIFYLPAGIKLKNGTAIPALISDLRRSSKIAKISPNFRIRLKRMPNVKNGIFYERFPLTDEIIGHQRSWHHSLLMNILYLDIFRGNLASGNLSYGFIKGPRIVNTKQVINSVIGSNVWLHPTSIVENTVICDNVKVGAKSVIRDSVIMGDSVIGDANIINRTLIGEDVNTLSNSVFFSSVIAPHSTVSNLGCYFSFIGKGSFVATAVIILWEGIDSTIKIGYGSDELDTKRYFLGAAIGEGSTLGARAILRPGTMIPNNSLVVLRPEEGVMKIPQNLSDSECYVWENASLARFEDIFPQFDKGDYF